MKSSWRGACLSGLVYPGLGQIAQKHYLRGGALIVIVTASLWVSVISATKHAQALLASLASDAGGYDMTTLLHEAGRITGTGDDRALEVSSLAIAGCWVVGIVDAYLSGKKMDADRTTHPRQR